MSDREKVMSWLEGLAEPDWRECYSDSEVQKTARQALDLIDELLKEQEAKIEQLNRFVNGFSRDAMPVVRCKDCAYLNRDTRFMNYGYCSYFKDEFYAKVNPDKNFYCGAGKRSVK